MEIVVFLPPVIGLLALGRAIYLLGWKAVMKADFRPHVPIAAKVGLFALLFAELVGLLMRLAGWLDADLARRLLSPIWQSVVVTLITGWVLILNWGRKELR
ncbi:hypothetical protein D3C87_825090 [compost metagenome]